MIDTDFPFFFEGNWTGSISKNGGTPGNPNSIISHNPDISFRGIINAFADDSSYLTLSFSEPVKNLEETVSGIRINNNVIKSVYASDPLMRKFIVKPSGFFSQHQPYSLTIPGTITDFAGNYPDINNFTFGLPEKCEKGDIVFNEILFNPLPGDPDFIELYNASAKIINSSGLYLVSISETGSYSIPVSVSDDNRCLLPGSYYAITTDRKSIYDRYFSSSRENIFQVNQLPSMPDDKGHLILLNRQLELIDEVSYNEEMHYSLLSGYEGISLEKVRPSLFSSDPKNWHSASEASGWGTPGAPNSIYSDQPVSSDNINLSSTKITPDNDGYEDLLVIDLKLEGNGNIVTIIVYDDTGGFICRLADNLLAGNQASVTWYGTRKDGSLVNSGIYIIFISVFDESGKTMKWKKVCSVLR
jgi:hypothetical protein